MYQIHFDAAGHVPYVGNWDESNLTPEITISLSSLKTIGGVVKDGSGKPIAGAKIEMTVPYDRPATPNNVITHCSGKQTTDAKGHWKMGGIPAEQFPKISSEKQNYFPRRIFLTHPDYKTETIQIDLRKLLPDAHGDYNYEFTMNKRN